MTASKAPGYFHQRFKDGGCIDPMLPRITNFKTEAQFQPRDKGLDFMVINPPIREWSFPNVMPVGQGYVGAVAAMDGHKLQVLDLNAMRGGPIEMPPGDFTNWIDDRIKEALERRPPDVIGIGGIITQYRRIKQIAALCKRILPRVPIILGGGMASCLPEFMVQRLAIDIAVREEGEATISEVLQCLENGLSLKGVRGIVYRDLQPGGGFEIVNNGPRPSFGPRQSGLDALPWPLRSRWPVKDVYRKNPVGHLNWASKWESGKRQATTPNSVSMIASRGCPYAVSACDYCYSSYLGNAYRLRSPREVADEMEFNSKEFEAPYIHFLDDLLLTDHKWALELFDDLRRRKRDYGFEVQWGGACRTNIIANDIIRAKKEGRPNILEQAFEAGMRQAGYGIESGSPTILKNIDKSGQTIEKIEIAIRETQRIFGYADSSFMIGSPGETRETVQETVDLCKRAGLAPEVIFFTTAYPGTKFWKLALEKGLIAKSVTGKKGPADDDVIEQYFLNLNEQGEAIRTNFSDLPDEEIAELSWRAINELGAQNRFRHPHTGDEKPASGAVQKKA